MTENRKDIYRIIDGERHYQDTLSSDRTDGHVHTVGEELVLLDVYIQQAKVAWASTAGDDYALNAVRKIAAIAVRCMENNGYIKRGR